MFYLKYHLYRHYFPLTALSRYRRLGGQPVAAAGKSNVQPPRALPDLHLAVRLQSKSPTLEGRITRQHLGWLKDEIAKGQARGTQIPSRCDFVAALLFQDRTIQRNSTGQVGITGSLGQFFRRRTQSIQSEIGSCEKQMSLSPIRSNAVVSLEPSDGSVQVAGFNEGPTDFKIEGRILIA